MAADTLNSIGVLKRREIEARILVPFVDALSEELAREDVTRILRETIVRVAREQGEALAEECGSRDLRSFAGALDAWTRDDALQLDVIEQNPGSLAFNVRRCRYAEMYRELGIPELGVILSCNRDAALIEGFNPEVEFTRTKTLMEGADCCDFRYSAAEHDA